MEEDKKIKNGLPKSLLILAIIFLIIGTCLELKFHKERENKTEEQLELDEKVSNLEKKINYLHENIYDNKISDNITEESNNKTSQKENISIESDFGKEISNYISKIWIMPEAYSDCMAEFSNIKIAPKDYLAVCASFRTMSKVGEDIYSAKATLGDFNSSLVELFGNDADGLIKASDIEKVFFVENNSDGTYHFSGFDGSEISYTDYIINKIEKQGDMFFVTQYEYKVEYDEIPFEINIGESSFGHIYDRNNNLILNTTIKATQEGNATTCKEYDENGKEIESIRDLLLSKYKNKLSVRTIELEYNISNNSFIMLNNKLEK